MKFGFSIVIPVLVFASRLAACDFSSHNPFLVSLLSAPIISFPKPNYPPSAKEKRIEGEVRVTVLINKRSGEVEQVCLVEGDNILGSAAMEAALKVKFWKKWSNYKTSSRKYKYLQGELRYNFKED